MIPLSLYIHTPWCIRKCPYCDFNSHKSPSSLPEKEYVEALVRDLKDDLIKFSPQPLHSVFIGGGTPTLFSAEAYEHLFFELRKVLSFTDDIEITMEANPGTVEQQRFSDYRALGINRLSLGIQSFNSTHLQVLGRIHDGAQAHKAIETARIAGFDNLNLDLMHSLPQQSVAQGIEDLQIALNYKPEHLSWYQLIIEPNTLFYKKKPELPDEYYACALEKQGFSLLKQHGYTRYEISAFSKPQRESRHNLNYWLFGDYYGIGAGAHGKLTTEEGIFRTRKHRQPTEYLQATKPFLAGSECVGKQDLIFEFMLNTTRLQQPIPYLLFFERTQLSLDYLWPKLMKAQSQGLVHLHEHHWQVTAFGRQFTNNLQSLFLPD